MGEIINRVRGWAGSAQQAFAWYRLQPLPSFGDQTAESVVKEGGAEAIKRHFDRIAVGGYAYPPATPGPYRPWKGTGYAASPMRGLERGNPQDEPQQLPLLRNPWRGIFSVRAMRVS
jgi:hypothetical protein